MPEKEAKARIKINKLLQDSGWRLLDNESGKANVVFENNVKITQKELDALGENFEKTTNGFIDYLLLDERSFPLIVLEAKSEDKNTLVGKEQARKYAKAQHCRFVILSNGNLHYFWDLEKGNPTIITRFPEQASVKNYQEYKPNPDKLIQELVEKDYLAVIKSPDYKTNPLWLDGRTKEEFIKVKDLRFLRPYQVKAVHSMQSEVKKGSDRFLFEMATGTGKTLTAAAIIRLFHRTSNARRTLFLVDRLELEIQANKEFNAVLTPDYKSVIYKERKDDWRYADIVVTTVQSLLFNNKFKRLFSPTDFDLVISDEAHRSIGGNARAVFEYFVGYKLGLTATPKDYLKKFHPENANVHDPREFERRLLLDTYRTFGCESGQPTFRYSLIDGVREGYLNNPVVVDARTDITTQLLSDEGYAVLVMNDEGDDGEQSYYQRDFERKFFSETTNKVLCKAFLDNALKDPISGEIGKTIVFAVSQHHAAKLTQILNVMADNLYPRKYQSDFAVQVTSHIPDAQQYSINFSDKNNNLLGTGNFLPWYKTSKARVCVTVGMMTTGYDCTDILNICLMRPIFSPTDFIQIKGRGTRKHSFLKQVQDKTRGKELLVYSEEMTHKSKFKLFDFFGNCEYFEEKFNYDEILKLPPMCKGERPLGEGPGVFTGEYENVNPDPLRKLEETFIGFEGMKIDRMFFQHFEEQVKDDAFVEENVMDGNWDRVLDYINREIMNKPEAFYTLDKLRKSVQADRRISLREILEFIFGLIPSIKSKNELLEEEFEKLITDHKPGEKDDVIALKYFFKTYITDNKVRDIIEKKKFAELNVNPAFPLEAYKALPTKWRSLIPEYIKDYVPLNKFMS